jgi:hypothetical protein
MWHSVNLIPQIILLLVSIQTELRQDAEAEALAAQQVFASHYCASITISAIFVSA